jgi:hypothetical protein
MQDSSPSFYQIQETPSVGLGLGLMLVPGGQVSMCVSVCVCNVVGCLYVRMHACVHHATLLACAINRL